jgi:rhodanese-related sulfurtransferase
MNIKEQILLHVSANEDEIDELLDDRSLMNLLTGICGKHKANLPIYNGIGKTRVLPSFSCFIFLYCLRGARSSKAEKILRKMGYGNVTSIGGIKGYKGKLVRYRNV